jgi:hypothetical protein
MPIHIAVDDLAVLIQKPNEAGMTTGNGYDAIEFFGR